MEDLRDITETLSRVDASLEALPKALREQASEQAAAARSALAWLTDTRHDVVFVGPVGIGKSVAVSALAGLLPAKREGDLDDRAVLTASGGRTTICTLRVERAEKTSVRIAPKSPEALHDLLRDVAYEALAAPGGDGAAERGLVPEESARAVRNMAGLRRKDVAALASQHEDEISLAARLAELVRTKERTRLEIDLPADFEGDQADWLRKTVSDVNSGRLDDVPMPASITIASPLVVDLRPGLHVGIVDTKGGDAGHVRDEVHQALHDDRTAVVVCSGFAAVPDRSAHAVLVHAKNVVGKVARGRVTVAALERHGESRAVLDESGRRVADRREGAAAKSAQARRVVDAAFPGGRVGIVTFDAAADDPSGLREAVVSCIESTRAARKAELDSLVEGLSWLLDERAAAGIERLVSALSLMSSAAARHETFDLPLPSVRDVSPLDRAVRPHSSTVWASSRRNGSFENLNLHSDIAGAYASACLTRAHEFANDFLSATEKLPADTDPVVASVGRRIRSQAEAMPSALAREVHASLTDVLSGSLGSDSALWKACSGTWGHAEERDGEGYVSFVSRNVNGWLDDASSVDAKIEATVASVWKTVIADPLAAACAGEDVPVPTPPVPAADFDPFPDKDRASYDLAAEIDANDAVLRTLADLDFEPRAPVAPRKPPVDEKTFISVLLAELLDEDREEGKSERAERDCRPPPAPRNPAQAASLAEQLQGARESLARFDEAFPGTRHVEGSLASDVPALLANIGFREDGLYPQPPSHVQVAGRSTALRWTGKGPPKAWIGTIYDDPFHGPVCLLAVYRIVPAPDGNVLSLDSCRAMSPDSDPYLGSPAFLHEAVIGMAPGAVDGAVVEWAARFARTVASLPPAPDLSNMPRQRHTRHPTLAFRGVDVEFVPRSTSECDIIPASVRVDVPGLSRGASIRVGGSYPGKVFAVDATTKRRRGGAAVDATAALVRTEFEDAVGSALRGPAPEVQAFLADAAFDADLKALSRMSRRALDARLTEDAARKITGELRRLAPHGWKEVAGSRFHAGATDSARRWDSELARGIAPPNVEDLAPR